MRVEFHSSYADVSKLPYNPSMPEFAFSGRSNAGKSSLINTLVNRSKLAFVSSTPGKTQLINLFLLNQRFFLVDLPGFGYAKASNQKRDELIVLVNEYLNFSRSLKVLFILCDSLRQVPEEELSLIDTALIKKIQPILIRTKYDKLNQKEKFRLKDEKNQLLARFPKLNIIFVSSKTGEGIEDIRKLIE